MMGCVAPYVNAILPPNYSILDSIKSAILNPVRLYHIIRGIHYNKTWISFEKGNFSSVKNYMGRTAWDKAMCELFHSGCNYYYCSEALRPSFIENQVNWVKPNNAKVQLLTIGCTTHWKGLDTLLKTANILKMKGFSFEWKVAGKMPDALKCEIEKKENKDFFSCDLIMVYDSYKIHAEFESTGIKKLIRLFGFLKEMVQGGIVFIDELDSNLHDVYLCALLEYLMEYGE